MIEHIKLLTTSEIEFIESHAPSIDPILYMMGTAIADGYRERAPERCADEVAKLLAQLSAKMFLLGKEHCLRTERMDHGLE